MGAASAVQADDNARNNHQVAAHLAHGNGLAEKNPVEEKNVHVCGAFQHIHCNHRQMGQAVKREQAAAQENGIRRHGGRIHEIGKAGQPFVHGGLFQNHLRAGGQENGKQVQADVEFHIHARPPPWKQE